MSVVQERVVTATDYAPPTETGSVALSPGRLAVRKGHLLIFSEGPSLDSAMKYGEQLRDGFDEEAYLDQVRQRGGVVEIDPAPDSGLELRGDGPTVVVDYPVIKGSTRSGFPFQARAVTTLGTEGLMSKTWAQVWSDSLSGADPLSPEQMPWGRESYDELVDMLRDWGSAEVRTRVDQPFEVSSQEIKVLTLGVLEDPLLRQYLGEIESLNARFEEEDPQVRVEDLTPTRALAYIERLVGLEPTSVPPSWERWDIRVRNAFNSSQLSPAIYQMIDRPGAIVAIGIGEDTSGQGHFAKRGTENVAFHLGKLY